MSVVLLTFGFFVLCFSAMAVGVILSDRSLRGSCGGDAVVDENGDEVGCGACPKKEVEICPSDDPLVRIAQIAHPNPDYHREGQL